MGLGEKYVNLVYNESFDTIGEVTPCIIGNVCGLLGNKETMREFNQGTMITKNNRTIIDAIYRNRNASFAESYLLRGVYSPKLILAVLLSDEDEYMAYFDSGGLKQDDYEERVRELYEFIEKEYYNQDDKEDYILRIWNNFNRIHLSKEYDKVSPQKEYTWIKKLNYQISKKKEEC